MALPSRVAASGNVFIESLTDDYTIVERNGSPFEVKNVKKATYVALQRDEEVTAVEGYGGTIKIDKASAPGAKPVYQPWIDSHEFYTDQRLCTLPFTLRAGKKANVEFRRTYTAPEQFCKIIMSSIDSTARYSVTVTVPAPLAGKIKVTPFRFPASGQFTTETDQKGNTVYRATIDNMPAMQHEKYAPLASVAAPALLVTGVFQGLDGLYSFLKSHVPDDPVDGPVAAKASELTAGLDSDIDKANAIAAWVRNNIRYVAIEHGEWAYRPDDAASCMAKLFGDCKCSANLIKTMLRSVGVDGRFCWIGTAGSVPHDWSDTPALCAGNHCIAAAVTGDSIIYLDGTVANCPSGYIPPSIQGRQVLIEDGDSYRLERVPVLPVESNTESYSARVTLSGDRSALAGVVRYTLTGKSHIAMASTYLKSQQADRKYLIESYLLDGNKSRQVDRPIFETGDSTVIRAVVIDPAAVTAAGTTLYVNLLPVSTALNPIDSPRRTQPVTGFTPCCRRSVINFAIPADFEVDNLPGAANLDNDWFTFNATYTLDSDGSSVTATYSLLEKGTDCPAARLDDYNAAVKTLKRLSSNRLTLKKRQ